jgi:hypothetical protein
VVTICTAILTFNKSTFCPHTVYKALCLSGSQNQQRLFPYTALTNWFIYTRFNTLRTSGHYMFRHLKKNSTFCPHTVYNALRLSRSQNQQRLFPYTALPDWFIYTRFNTLRTSGHYMFRHLKKKIQLSAHTQYIMLYVCLDLRTNSDYFLIQH